MLSLAILALVLAQIPDAPTPKQSPPPSSASFELQGDRLGESLDTFVSQHPKAECDTSQTSRAVCYQWTDVAIFGMTAHAAANCTLKRRYASDCLQGITAKFTDGRLVSLAYTLAGTDKAAAIAALKNKFGTPGKNSSEGTVWNKGDATASVIVGEPTETGDSAASITIAISTTN
jgi:hypothetical protein